MKSPDLLIRATPALMTLGLLALFAGGCAQNKRPDQTIQPVSSCALTGKWVACGTDGSGNSQSITIEATGTNLEETFMDFPEVEDCSGTGTPSMSFTASYELGTYRASTRISGATDAVITPSIDFGCGVANPAYTSLLFDASCTSFQPAEGTPGCTPETAPTSIGWLVFVKQ